MLAENLVMTSWCMMMSATVTVPREWHFYIADMTLVIVLTLVSWAFQVVYYKISHTWAETNFNPSTSAFKLSGRRSRNKKKEQKSNDIPMHHPVCSINNRS